MNKIGNGIAWAGFWIGLGLSNFNGCSVKDHERFKPKASEQTSGPNVVEGFDARGLVLFQSPALHGLSSCRVRGV